MNFSIIQDEINFTDNRCKISAYRTDFGMLFKLKPEIEYEMHYLTIHLKNKSPLVSYTQLHTSIMISNYSKKYGDCSQ